VVATLLPQNVNTVIKKGWQINRWVIPDADDKIYDIDGPTVGIGFNINHTAETYASFSQWVTWNGEQCSDSAQGGWHYFAAVDADKNFDAAKPKDQANADTELNDLGAGNPALPEQSRYQPR